MATLAEQLTSVQTAIAAIESGVQSIGQDGRTLTYANLETLYKREKELKAEIACEAGATRTVAEF